MGANLRFETGVVSDAADRGGRRARLLPVSVVLHAAVLATIVVIPILLNDANPEPVSAVRAFLVEPAIAPPPPPPPPAAARTAASAPTPRPTPAPDRSFTAPVDAPSEIEPEDSLDTGDAAGVAGGVEGGVPGGVVGGVVGGLPEAPPSTVEPVRVGGFIKEPRKLKGGSLVYPQIARDARVQGTVVIEAVIGADGRVTGARVLRGIPLLDEPALASVRQSVYAPTLLDGVPTPIVMTVVVTFRLTPSA